jgi:hypothetical protein
MVADESSGVGNLHTHDNGTRQQIHHRPTNDLGGRMNLDTVHGGSENCRRQHCGVVVAIWAKNTAET